MGVVPTTILPPRAAHKYVTRDAIERLAKDVGTARVVTVSSPAGFGKTTAMLRWAEILAAQGRPVLWIAARAGIGSLASFEAALRQALIATGLPGIDESLEHDRQAWLASLSSVSGPKPVLFIDDAQLLAGDIRDFIEQLVASARDALTTVIASRGECGINLARLRSLGHLLEVRVRHLCFDTDEAATLIQQQVHSPIPAGEIQRIVVDTQGWAAGLILAAGAWQRDLAEGYPPEGGTTGLRHEFASYFHEEVVEGLPQNIRDFIVDTSILGELTPSACAAVVATENARTMLEQVFERGLFLAELDRELSRYRYYSLFRDMVFGRLMMRAPDRAAELHRRASRFFAGCGDLQLGPRSRGSER
jgi:LuxR family transcriptional regulator, maltose regulon positive regulatory protein